MTTPCPACDVAHSDDPLFCLAVGIAIGTAFLDMHRATEMMCAAHRVPYVMAMMRAQVAVNTTKEDKFRTGDEALAEWAAEHGNAPESPDGSAKEGGEAP